MVPSYGLDPLSGIVVWQCLIRSGAVGADTLTTPSGSVVCLIRIAYTDFLSQSRRCPVLKSEMVWCA